MWTLDDPVSVLPGVGPKRCSQLLQMGITSLGDLLLHIPLRYEDRRQVVPISQIQDGMTCTVRGEVVTGSSRRVAGRGTRFEAVIRDESGVMTCSWFNAAYLEDVIKANAKIVVFGAVTAHKGALSMSHPEYQVGENALEIDGFACLLPVYPSTEGVSQNAIRGWLSVLSQRFGENLQERLPKTIRDQCGLLSLHRALRQVHAPEELDDAIDGRCRLVFEEFFEIQLILALRKAFYAKRVQGTAHIGDGRLSQRLVERLPFSLTADQDQVLAEIRADMASIHPLHRLVQGDVGSGKTIVAVLAMVTAVEAGAQAALMVPTEILAQQHLATLKEMLEPLGLRVGCLVGSVKGRLREETLSQVSGGEIDIVVGTHALIQEWVEFERLGLVVIDEQHKFGVSQRGRLYEKGQAPDVLVMTATPIPRTLAMTIYGDLDISVIRGLPEGRQAIDTRVIGEEKLDAAYGFICKQVEKGRQAYIVYPLVEESEHTELKSVVERFETLSHTVFTGISCALVHGQLSPDEKTAAMNGFVSGEVSILFATTVIEVGVDVANATVMLVENAERFGLAQLHQLRGRTGRGVHKSFCVLQTSVGGGPSRDRLKVMEDSSDGFQLSEADFAIRGMGNLLGREQSGLPPLRIGDPIEDVELLQSARREAFALVENDPHLEACPLLKARVVELYEAVREFVTVG